MRGVAKAAGTTTPTVYERYRDRDDILRAVRLQTRVRTFRYPSRLPHAGASVRVAISNLPSSIATPMKFSSTTSPSPRLCTNRGLLSICMRERLTKRLGGTPRQHTRLMLSLWSLMHGTAMLDDPRRRSGSRCARRWFHACLDARRSNCGREAAAQKARPARDPKWPAESDSWGGFAEAKSSHLRMTTGRAGFNRQAGRKNKSGERESQRNALPDCRL
jgi:AcrR family transcriptional regulator